MMFSSHKLLFVYLTLLSHAHSYDQVLNGKVWYSNPSLYRQKYDQVLNAKVWYPNPSLYRRNITNLVTRKPCNTYNLLTMTFLIRINKLFAIFMTSHFI